MPRLNVSNPTTTDRFLFPSAAEAFQTGGASTRLQTKIDARRLRIEQIPVCVYCRTPQQCCLHGTNLRRVIVPRSDRVFAYQARPRYGENRPQVAGVVPDLKVFKPPCGRCRADPS